MTVNSLLGPRTAFPDFNKISLDDFLPAADRVLAGAAARVEAIKSVAAPADFANTIVPLESLFHPLQDLQYLLAFYKANAFDEQVGAIAAALAQKASAASKTLFQDPVLGARFKNVYDRKAQLAKDDDDLALLDSLYQQFETSGALLPAAADKARLKAIDDELILLTKQFDDNTREGARQQAVHVTDPAALKGLGADKISAFAEAAQKAGLPGWLIVPERLMVDEMLPQLENRPLREKLHRALDAIGTQAPYDNRPVLARIHQKRQERATLLGYPNYAVFARSRHMYKDLPKVEALLDDIAARALPQFEKDMRTLQAFAASKGGPAKLEPWDVAYWANLHCADLYKFDAGAMSSYLELDRMMEGLIAHEEKLLDVEFRRSHAHSTLHPDIRVYEVFNRSSGALQGVLHVDLFARPDSKGDGAWVENVQMADADRPAIATVNMNIAKPADPSTPARMDAGSVETLYHEFGHAMHAICGDRPKYRSLQGLMAPSDFVELPSMINESWALRPDLLGKHAVNSRTGRTLPPALMKAFTASHGYFGTRDVMRLVQNSLWDFAFHKTDHAHFTGSAGIQAKATVASPYAAHIRPYPLTRFGHLFSSEPSGYAAGYFNYMLADILAKDGAALFEKDPYEAGSLSRLRTLLREGSGGNLLKRYVAFRGREAAPDALLKYAGIAP